MITIFLPDFENVLPRAMVTVTDRRAKGLPIHFRYQEILRLQR